MEKESQIEEFAAAVKSFFLLFDGYFTHNPQAEDLLAQVKESLEETINYKESALPVIIAMGGSYDSEIDRAKVKEVTALLELLKARKNLRDATIREGRRDKDNAATLLALFGME